MFGSESHVHRVEPHTDIGCSRAYAYRIHAPKHEKFDLVARTNTDPKGIVRAVDVYTVRPWGLYMARPTPGRAQFHYLESWLLPALGLRASIFHFNPGHERDQDYYLDVGRFTPGPVVWHSEDHYLDLVVRSGRSVELDDVDELLTAVRHGLLSPETGEEAVRSALDAVEGLSRNGYDLDLWLSRNGLDLTWRGAVGSLP
jgi:predicted RNA-binding protein associated with RNAse of E/G family